MAGKAWVQQQAGRVDCMACSMALMPPKMCLLLRAAIRSGDSPTPSTDPAFDILSADCWPDVREEDVLLQPHEIRTTWREFLSASNVQVQQVSGPCTRAVWAVGVQAQQVSGGQ